MVFADIKNDFVFRRIFATRLDLLRGLLNDLLERTDARTIESLEYLPSEQLPLVPGFKLSILDVRCRDRSGAVFIVEMQLVHITGFLDRVIYNGSKAYVNQLKSGESYTKVVDVVAIAICDFELWPDAQQDKLGEPRIPMLSRFGILARTNLELQRCGLARCVDFSRHAGSNNPMPASARALTKMTSALPASWTNQAVLPESSNGSFRRKKDPSCPERTNLTNTPIGRTNSRHTRE